jgi:elongation factor G
MFVVTRMDAENARFDEVVAALQETFGAACTPLMLPVGSGSNYRGVVNLLHPGEVPDSMQDLVETQRGVLMESVISGDDTLLERYLEGETIPPAELERVVTPVLVEKTMIPILCCAAEQDRGVAELLDIIATYAPSPAYARKQILNDQGDREDHVIDLEGGTGL